MADIFVSYAKNDSGRIKRLIEALEGQGWSVWWDYKIRPGRSFDKVIEAEIAKAKCIIVLWSKESVGSDWVKSEAEEGRRRGVLAPALIDDVTIPLGFRRIEAAKLYDWRGDPSDPELNLLLSAIGEILDSPPSPPPIPHPFYRRLNKWSLIAGFAAAGVFVAVSIPAFKYFLTPTPSPNPIVSPSSQTPTPTPITMLVAGPSPSPKFSATATPTPAPQPSPTPQLDAQGEFVGAVVEKVSGEGQVIPLSGYNNFTVRVVDARGRPIAGAKVSWQTPIGGSKVYVGETDIYGMSSATNIWTFPNAGIFEQTATLVSRKTQAGFHEAGAVVAVGNKVTFTYQQR